MKDEKKSRVAVFGGANLDIQAKCSAPYLAGDSNPGSLRISPGGVGRNIAANLAGLGVQTELVSLFGTDIMASVLTDSCKAAGIRYDRSIFLPGAASSAYVCLLDADGSLAGAVAAMELFEAAGPELMRNSWQAGDEADLVVLDGNLPPLVLKEALDRWQGKPVLFDPVSVAKAGRVGEALSALHMIKPNLREAEFLAGLGTPSQVRPGLAAREGGASREDAVVQRARKAAKALVSIGVREAFVSIASSGMVYADSKRCGLVSVLELPVVNVSGAGDAAAAGIATATLYGYDITAKATMAMALASHCAACASTVAEDLSLDALVAAAKRVRNVSL